MITHNLRLAFDDMFDIVSVENAPGGKKVGLKSKDVKNAIEATMDVAPGELEEDDWEHIRNPVAR